MNNHPQTLSYRALPGNGGRSGTVLIDGTFQATWRIAVAGGKATLQIKPFARLPKADEDALTAEGARLLAFAADAASDHDIRLIDPGTGTTPAAL